MTDFSDFYQIILKNSLSVWINTLPTQLSHWKQKALLHGKFIKWFNVVNQIPTVTPTSLDLLHGINAYCDPPISDRQKSDIEKLLRQLVPWKKGPFSLYDIVIDTEWRSDWKWDRIMPHMTSLDGHMVLDIGCGSGYHLWRMVGAGAQLAIGLDPIPLFYCQFEAVRKLLGRDFRAHLLPLRIEQVSSLPMFDSVFSMGVLYHCRSPLDHLLQIKNYLVRGGKLILETLVIQGDEYQVLVPHTRYANMRNVYFIPSPSALVRWLERCGFVNIRQVNHSITTIEEQRSTSWMPGQSLSDFLHPDDCRLTLEGYPAPMRAVIMAEIP